MNFDIAGPLPTGTTVLEASAGTGKTWTIAALVTRMIAEQEVDITDLLIITFTRAAANELRSRVRERLVGAAAELGAVAAGHGIGEVDDLTFLLATGRPRSTGSTVPRPAAELRRMVQRLREATADIDAATITTIHGFCHAALEGLGIAGDRDAGLTLVESAEDLLAEVVDDVYLRMFLHTEQPPPFTHDHAGRIARAVTGNPSAVIHPPEPHLPEPHPPEAAARVALARAIREEFDDRKRDLGIRTYDDLLTSLAAIVDPPGGDGPLAEAARNRLRRRWRGVLVDEFQDTDDTQWRILRSTFHGHGPLTLIGDPKQAIYSFRGGDVATYLQATRGAQRRTLGFNYRSDAELVGNLNGLLEDAELGHEEIRVRPIGQGKPHCDVRLAPREGGRLRLRVVDAEEFPRARHGVPKIGALREAIAADVAVDITHLLNAGHEVRAGAGSWRPAEAGDVAVLCHTNDDAHRILRALTDVGVQGVVSGGVGVFHSQGAQDWLTLLEAMDQPSNTSVVSSAALTPFFGYRATDLLRARDDVLDTVGRRLREYSHLLTDHGAASVFHAARGRGEEGMALGLLQHHGGERRVTDLRHLAELMHAEHPRASAHALALWLRREREASRTEHVRRLESDDSAVQIYTIHSAKGLQFPFVYLPTAATESLPNNDYPAFHHDGQRVVDVTGRPQGERKKRVDEENMAERSRLLYVGLTRGIGQVTTYWAPAQHVGDTALHRLLTRSGARFDAKTPAADVRREISVHWGEHVRVEPLEDRPALAVAIPDGRPGGDARAWTRRIDRAWRRSSYTSLAAGAEAHGADPGADPGAEQIEEEFKESPVELAPTGPALPPPLVRSGGADGVHLPSPMADLPRGAHFGSLVHAVLEEVDTRAGDLAAEVAGRVDQQLPSWPQDLDTQVLTRAITAVLTTPLTPAVPATLRDLDPDQQLAELDFELPLDGGERSTGGGRTTLRSLAPILRRHLEEGDPLRRYADTLDTPAFDAQPLRGYLTGSIDLVFAREGKFYVADYKTNWLGEEPNTTAAYDIGNLRAAMEGSSYPLQALLYTVALHRYLTWRLPGYDPAEHIGGVLYLYVRGMAGPHTPVVDGHSTGVFSWVPPPGLIEEISARLDPQGGSR